MPGCATIDESHMRTERQWDRGPLPCRYGQDGSQDVLNVRSLHEEAVRACAHRLEHCLVVFVHRQNDHPKCGGCRPAIVQARHSEIGEHDVGLLTLNDGEKWPRPTLRSSPVQGRG